MTILVTGGAGYVGSHFVWAAHAQGRRIVVLDDLSAGTKASLPDAVQFFQGDVADHQLVNDIIRHSGITAVVHFAGKIQVGESVRDPATYFESNLKKTIHLLDTLRAANVLDFVFSSSAGVYGKADSGAIAESLAPQPVSPYGMSKLAVEYILASYGPAYGVRWAALRYFNAAGASPAGNLRESHQPETHLIPLAIDAAVGRGPALTIHGVDYSTPDGTCVRDYVHVCDLAEGHLLALDCLASNKAVGVLNLGNGTGHSVKQVIAECERVVGNPVPHLVGKRRPGDPPSLVANIDRAKDLLGWSPQWSSLRTIITDAFRARHPR